MNTALEMTIGQIVETVRILIDGRHVIGRVWISRETGTSDWEVVAKLRNKDGIGYRVTTLACFGDSATAVRLKNALK